MKTTLKLTLAFAALLLITADAHAFGTEAPAFELPWRIDSITPNSYRAVMPGVSGTVTVRRRGNTITIQRSNPLAPLPLLPPFPPPRPRPSYDNYTD